MKSNFFRKIVVPAAVLLLAGCGKGGGIVSSVTPESGSGANAALTVSFNDSKGVAHIKSARVLINGALDGREACYVFYDRLQDAFVLINDSGEGSKGFTAGAGGPENKQCRLDKAESSVSADSNTLTLRVNIAFKPVFKGRKQVFLALDDAEGHAPDLQPHGTWIVPNR